MFKAIDEIMQSSWSQIFFFYNRQVIFLPLMLNWFGSNFKFVPLLKCYQNISFLPYLWYKISVSRDVQKMLASGSDIISFVSIPTSGISVERSIRGWGDGGSMDTVIHEGSCFLTKIACTMSRPGVVPETPRIAYGSYRQCIRKRKLGKISRGSSDFIFLSLCIFLMELLLY